MREHVGKRLLRTLCFPPGAVRRIRFGSLRGLVFRVSDVTGMSPWYSGTERAHQRAMAALVRPGDVAVDVGANWGVHTLLLSRLVGPRGRVLSLEPLPRAFEALRWHLDANGCRNVTPMPVALGDFDGTARFVPGASHSQGVLAAARPGAGGDPADGFPVTLRTLDSLVQELGLRAVRLVKIDVEGAESMVLRGAARTLERFRPHLIVDLHTPEQDVLVAGLLTARGYTLSRLEGPPILRTDAGWPDPTGVWGSLLASPAETAA
jgi:FkbM family methyltransferase